MAMRGWRLSRRGGPPPIIASAVFLMASCIRGGRFDNSLPLLAHLKLTRIILENNPSQTVYLQNDNGQNLLCQEIGMKRCNRIMSATYPPPHLHSAYLSSNPGKWRSLFGYSVSSLFPD